MQKSRMPHVARRSPPPNRCRGYAAEIVPISLARFRPWLEPRRSIAHYEPVSRGRRPLQPFRRCNGSGHRAGAVKWPPLMWPITAVSCLQHTSLIRSGREPGKVDGPPVMDGAWIPYFAWPIPTIPLRAVGPVPWTPPPPRQWPDPRQASF